MILGEIPSLGAIMSVTDMPVLNYDVIYDMCEPQLKGGVSNRPGGGVGNRNTLSRISRDRNKLQDADQCLI